MRCSARAHTHERERERFSQLAKSTTTHVEHGLTMEHGFLCALVVREATISARSALAVGSPKSARVGV